MSFLDLVGPLGLLGLGALIGWLAGGFFRARGNASDRLDAAERLAAAEATATAERERRQSAEIELQEVEARAGELDRALAVAGERVDAAQRLLAEQKEFVASSKKELEDAFQAMAATALKGSSEQLLALAEQRLATAQTRAAADLEQRQQAIEKLLQPLGETLGRLETSTGEIEKQRVEAYSRLDEQIRQLAETTVALNEKTTSLSTAMRGSEVRGRWGEIALRNVAELAGMTAHCDFDEQSTLDDGKRPDMTVKLPGRRRIAVDAKAPLTAYLEAMEATDETARNEAMGRHVTALRNHVRQLAARDYAQSLDAEIDLVVMFLPGDPFLSAAFTLDPELQIEALRSKVVIATPSTLVALLRTVAIYWQQQSLADNAEAIASAAKELYERASKFGEELSQVGRGLSTAIDAYNRAVGSFERRLMPLAGRLEELKVAEQTKRELRSPDVIERSVRKVSS